MAIFDRPEVERRMLAFPAGLEKVTDLLDRTAFEDVRGAALKLLGAMLNDGHCSPDVQNLVAFSDCFSKLLDLTSMEEEDGPGVQCVKLITATVNGNAVTHKLFCSGGYLGLMEQLITITTMDLEPSYGGQEVQLLEWRQDQIIAALQLCHTLVTQQQQPAAAGTNAVLQSPGLLRCITEAALAHKQPGAAAASQSQTFLSWQRYGLSQGVQQEAVRCLAAVLSSGPEAKAAFGSLSIRSAPEASQLRTANATGASFNALPLLLQTVGMGVEGLAAVVEAFLAGNKAWCVSALAGGEEAEAAMAGPLVRQAFLVAGEGSDASEPAGLSPVHATAALSVLEQLVAEGGGEAQLLLAAERLSSTSRQRASLSKPALELGFDMLGEGCELLGRGREAGVSCEKESGPAELCRYCIALTRLLCVWVYRSSELCVRVLSVNRNWQLLSYLSKASAVATGEDAGELPLLNALISSLFGFLFAGLNQATTSRGNEEASLKPSAGQGHSHHLTQQSFLRGASHWVDLGVLSNGIATAKHYGPVIGGSLGRLLASELPSVQESMVLTAASSVGVEEVTAALLRSQQTRLDDQDLQLEALREEVARRDREIERLSQALNLSREQKGSETKEMGPGASSAGASLPDADERADEGPLLAAAGQTENQDDRVAAPQPVQAESDARATWGSEGDVWVEGTAVSPPSMAGYGQESQPQPAAGFAQEDVAAAPQPAQAESDAQAVWGSEGDVWGEGTAASPPSMAAYGQEGQPQPVAGFAQEDVAAAPQPAQAESDAQAMWGSEGDVWGEGTAVSPPSMAACGQEGQPQPAAGFVQEDVAAAPQPVQAESDAQTMWGAKGGDFMAPSSEGYQSDKGLLAHPHEPDRSDGFGYGAAEPELSSPRNVPVAMEGDTNATAVASSLARPPAQEAKMSGSVMEKVLHESAMSSVGASAAFGEYGDEGVFCHDPASQGATAALAFFGAEA
ncbi:unnamed protein product [Chrysoparadoxa australica]